MEIQKSSGMLLIVLSTLVMSASYKDGGFFSRKSTVYGQVTEIGGSGLDSIAVIFVAARLSSEKGLLRIYTDKNGNFSGTVDVPKRYGTLSIAVAENGNPKYADVYRGDVTWFRFGLHFCGLVNI